MVYQTSRRPLRALVEPIPPKLAKTLEQPFASTSRTRVGQVAYASTELYEQLQKQNKCRAASDGEEGEYGERELRVAVTWPAERRLLSKGKNRELSLCIRVERLPNELSESHPQRSSTLYVDASLLPRSSIPPLPSIILVQNLIPLTSVVLQTVQSEADDEPPDIDLSSVLDELSGDSIQQVNGHSMNGQQRASRPLILRQGDTLELRNNKVLRVLMLEPVLQGICSEKTRLILSTTPHVLRGSPESDLVDAYDPDIDGEIRSHRSVPKSRLSLDDFDPDAFLSGSLSLSLSHDDLGSPIKEEDGGELDYLQATYHSSGTSGSTTPRANGIRPVSPAVPVETVLSASINGLADAVESGTRFTAIKASGPARATADPVVGHDVVWVGVGGLGRAGIFEGDWVIIRSNGIPSSSINGRLVKVLAWERLDEDEDEIHDGNLLPANPILLCPDLHRNLFTSSSSGSASTITSTEVVLSPTAFGARLPTLPMAKTITVARLATTDALDKRYERSWLKGLRKHFKQASQNGDAEEGLILRRGDIFSVPIWLGRPVSPDDEEAGDSSDSEDSEDERDRPTFAVARSKQQQASAIAYFQITSISFDPLVPLEDDFTSSVSSKARAGELGVWANVGSDTGTKLVLAGVERARVQVRSGDRAWHDLSPIPRPASLNASTKLRELLSTSFLSSGFAMFQLSILITGARGAGKMTLVNSLADELGLNVVHINCYDIIGDTPQVLQGILSARTDKAKSASPSVLLLHHIEALAKKSESTALGRPPAIVKVLEDALADLRKGASETAWPCVMIGTTVDPDVVPGELLAVFKQDIALPVRLPGWSVLLFETGTFKLIGQAPSVTERQSIADTLLNDVHLAPDISPNNLAAQTAALHAGDIRSLIHRAQDISLRRATSASHRAVPEVKRSGISITSADLSTALGDARSSYSDSIGAPKIPNVSWDDIGGLASVKDEILETIQLPLDHPELFASGLKKRSGILLYGPPGTGKTLLAKAVATSCSLNFFSVKGPELLNMYIGESEANVRRIFQRARDAAPCVIFMDELDSVAPKRGNQGDSGGVMDRIVSQLLAELDGMSKGDSGDVYVMGATNRPDLLDTALLRPGRFDRMVYLSPPKSHQEQLDILKALTRKFDLEPSLDLEDVAEMCEFNLTGADLYALASDAMLGAMTRVAESVDHRIKDLEEERALYEDPEVSKFPNGNAHPLGEQDRPGTRKGEVNGERHWTWPKPLTPQYYLSTIATPDEIKVRVGMVDFEQALRRLRPSVSVQEMKHYEAVQGQFRGSQNG